MTYIWESKEELEKRMKQQRDVQKLQRLQMLYLIKTQQAKKRKEVGQILNVSREVVGQWLMRYEEGGVEKLLQIKPKRGTKSSLPTEVIAAIREKLGQAEGVSSYVALLEWVKESFAITTSYRVIYYTARDVLGARLAVARKSHSKKKKAHKKPSKRVLKLELDMQSSIKNQ